MENGWPALPYKGLNFYTGDDASLFSEREVEAEECAQIIGNFATKMLLLHGRTGTGKSSFLRAGLFQRLMQNPRLFCIRMAHSAEPAMVRSTGDPIASMMDLLHNRLSDPQAFADIPPDAKLSARKSLECLPGATGATRAEGLLAALRTVTSRLPGTLILAVDQAEEVFTLATDESTEVRRAWFDLLDNLCHDRFDIKLILSLRTEYYGQFADSFRLAPDLSVSTVQSGLEQFMLHGIDAPSRLESVILRPTLKVSPLSHVKPPFEQYQFQFEDGLVPTIVSDVLHHCGESSTLPIVQLVCLDLYNDLRARNGSVILRSAYETRGGVRGAIHRYFDKAIAEATRTHHKARQASLHAWRDVLSLLVAMQEGGALTSLLLPRSYLVEEAQKFGAPEPIQTTLSRMATAELRLLREVDLRDSESGAHVLHYSLGHDALAGPLHEWKKGQQDRLKSKKVKHRAMLVASACLGGVVLFATVTCFAIYAAYSARRAAVEAILQSVETEPRLGSRILMLTAIKKNADWMERKMLPMNDLDVALRNTLARTPFFAAAATCAGFDVTGYWLGLSVDGDSSTAVNIQALANHKASQLLTVPHVPGTTQRQCATGFVEGLSQPVLLTNDTLRYSTSTKSVVTSLKSIAGDLPEPRWSEFGATRFRTTTFRFKQNQKFAQTYYDFVFDGNDGRFKPTHKIPPTADISSRYGPVFSDTTQYFAYTVTSSATPPRETAASESADAAAATTGQKQEDDRMVRLIVRSRDTPQTDTFVVPDTLSYPDDNEQLLPWSVSFLPSYDGSLVYRRRTDNFVFVLLKNGDPSTLVTKTYLIKSDLNGLRPVPAQFTWARPLLAAVSASDGYRVAWITSDGITTFRSDESRQELVPLMNHTTLLPAFGDADQKSQLRFTRDGDVLLFIRHQFNGVTVYAWDVTQKRQAEIKHMKEDDLLKDACRVAANIAYPALDDKDLKRLPRTFRIQPCSD